MEKENEEFDALEAKQFVRERISTGESVNSIRIAVAFGKLTNKSVKEVYKAVDEANGMIQEIFREI